MPAGGIVDALTARLAGSNLDWRVIFLAGGLVPLALVPETLMLLLKTRPGPEPAADRTETLGCAVLLRAASLTLEASMDPSDDRSIEPLEEWFLESAT